MRLRFLLFAGLGLALCCAVAAVLPREPPAPAPSFACPALAPRLASADRIELVHAGHVLWLQRRGQVWGMPQQGGYPVRPEPAEALVQALQTVRLLEPASGAPDSVGLGDPFSPDPSSGTFVRMLGTSGATLCAVVTGPPGMKRLRRPAEPQAWTTDTPIPASADIASWSEHALPPLDRAQIQAVLDDGGLGAGTVEAALSALPFADVGAAPQHHPAPVRVVQLALSTGTAVLTVGMERGQPWLLVSGTSDWARRLAPYAFVLPPTSPLAAL